MTKVYPEAYFRVTYARYNLDKAREALSQDTVPIIEADPELTALYADVDEQIQRADAILSMVYRKLFFHFERPSTGGDTVPAAGSQ